MTMRFIAALFAGGALIANADQVVPLATVASGIEVVPGDPTVRIWGLPVQWISAKQGLVVTSEILEPVRFRTSGILRVRSLHSGLLLHSITTPAQVLAMGGDGDTPSIIVAGGPFGKNYDDVPFIWQVDLRSGTVMAELPLWKGIDREGRPYLPEIRGAGLSPDGKGFQLIYQDSSGVEYNLATPTLKPRFIKKTETRHQVSVPNWMSESQANDGLLLVGEDEDGAGVWRMDTWEKIMSLGPRRADGRIADWIPSPDGAVLLTVRSEPSDRHLIWDLKNFAVHEWTVERLNTSCMPAFTDDGQILRYCRLIGENRMEFVSRDWRTGEETVELESPLAEDSKMAPEGRIRWRDTNAHFSDDAKSLIVDTSSEPKATILHWSKPGLSKPEIRHVDFNFLGVNLRSEGISGDGERVYYMTSELREYIDSKHRKDSKVYYGLKEVQIDSRRPVDVYPTDEMMHSPYHQFHSHPAVLGEAITKRQNGSSLGPYGFELYTREGSKPWHQRVEVTTDRLLSACFLRPAGGGQPVMLANYDNAIRIFDSKTFSKTAEILRQDLWSGEVNRIAAPLSGRVFLPLKNSGLQIYDVLPNGSFKPLCQLWSPVPGSWLAMQMDGRYAISPSANPPVSFRLGGKLHPVEDFDVLMDQPDALAETLGCSADVVSHFRLRRERRIQRLKLPPTSPGDGPTVILNDTPPLVCDSGQLRVEGQIHSATGPVTHLDLYVNDVPVFGIHGKVFEGPDTGITPFQLDVPLSNGSNKVQLSVRDEFGRRSASELFLVHRTQDLNLPERIIIAVGISNYDDSAVKDLNYAEKDAADISAALAAVPGHFRSTRNLVLTGRKANKAGILAARAFLKSSKPEDEVIVFLAGHGKVDRGLFYFYPSDCHPAVPDSLLSFADLESLFDGIPALNRLLLIDSCQSGLVSEEDEEKLTDLNKIPSDAAPRGIRFRSLRTAADGPPLVPLEKERLLQTVSDNFLDLRRTTGATVLTAAAGLEYAIETPATQNGFFTYALLEVLHGSAGDKHEARVVKASDLISRTADIVRDLSGGSQNPSARFTNLAMDFPVVASALEFPPGKPEDVVRNFVDWSKFASMSRLASCFAPQVDYFGKVSTLAAIEAEETEYRKEFRISKNLIKTLQVSPAGIDGTATIRYELEFVHACYKSEAEARKLVTRPGWRRGGGSMQDSKDRRIQLPLMERFGTIQMEARVRPFGREWKIVSLKVSK